jgi:2-(3-amino-3-carboxypropyl)histidine synthase
MKTLFIPAKSKHKVNKIKIFEISKKLPKNLAITYSIQYKDIASEIKKILSKEHKITSFIQILGCSKPKFPKNTNALLLVSDGKFHAISLAFETKLPVYLLDHNKLEQISQEDLEIIEKRKKASYLKFLNADKIGILVSTKPGQQNLKKAMDFKKKTQNKKSYLFISNNIDTKEFENFQLNCFVNTACPRLDMDSPIIYQA